MKSDAAKTHTHMRAPVPATTRASAHTQSAAALQAYLPSTKKTHAKKTNGFFLNNQR